VSWGTNGVDQIFKLLFENHVIDQTAKRLEKVHRFTKSTALECIMHITKLTIYSMPSANKKSTMQFITMV